MFCFALRVCVCLFVFKSKHWAIEWDCRRLFDWFRSLCRIEGFPTPRIPLRISVLRQSPENEPGSSDYVRLVFKNVTATKLKKKNISLLMFSETPRIPLGVNVPKRSFQKWAKRLSHSWLTSLKAAWLIYTTRVSVFLTSAGSAEASRFSKIPWRSFASAVKDFPMSEIVEN